MNYREGNVVEGNVLCFEILWTLANASLYAACRKYSDLLDIDNNIPYNAVTPIHLFAGNRQSFTA